MSRYSGARDTKLPVDRNYLRQGRYILLIDLVEERKARKGREFNIIEFTVAAASTHAKGNFIEPWSKREIPPQRVGEEVANLMMTDKEQFMQNWMGFLLAATNSTKADIEEAARKNYPEVWAQDQSRAFDLEFAANSQQAVGPDQPLAGVYVEVDVEMKLKKDSRNKPEAALRPEDFFTNITYVRRIDDEAELKAAGVAA